MQQSAAESPSSWYCDTNSLQDHFGARLRTSIPALVTASHALAVHHACLKLGQVIQGFPAW